jgi:hypothetical protein
MTGAGRENAAAKPEQGVLGTLLELLVADRTVFTPGANGDAPPEEVLAARR